jgi:hypothetical protein
MPLKQTLTEMMTQAEATYPKAVKIDLPGSLTINLRKAPKDADTYEYILTIWRYNVHPSLTEWAVVCKNFPYRFSVPTPEKGIVLRKHYLKARIPLPKETNP